MSRCCRVVLCACMGVGLAGLAGRAVQAQDLPPANPSPTFQVPEGIAFDQELQVGPDGEVVLNQVRTLSPDEGSHAASAADIEKAPVLPERALSRISPALEGLPPGDLLDVVVTFRRHDRIPALPRNVDGVLRTEEPNRSIREQRLQVLDEVASRRLERLPESLALLSALGGIPLEYHVVGNAVSATLPASVLPTLAADPEVAFIEPAQTTTPPPDANSANDVDDGRTLIRSDLMWSFGFTGSGAGQFVGILDTGVRSSHTLLTSPARTYWERDCVYGGSQCETTGDANYNPDDNCWNHGTATASIVSGNGNLTATYRGVTDALVDSFKVYTCAGLSVTAAIRGFGAALAGGDDVIVAQVQAQESETSALAAAADDAFDAGSVVVAPVGNGGPWSSSVTCPANAHKVLGVGAIDVQTLAILGIQGRGPAADDRIKPDLQAPTNTETASTSCSTCLQVFGGTSGATPYAGGAAMLLFDYFKAQGWATNPGLIYSALLAFGIRPYPYFDNSYGVGRFELGDLSCRHWVSGSRSVGAGQDVDITFNTSTYGNGDRDLRVAIWWPEDTNYHNDIDLSVIDAQGTVKEVSISGPSVFEFVALPGALTPAGTWRVRLNGYSVPQSPQTVYFLMYNKTWCAP